MFRLGARLAAVALIAAGAGLAQKVISAKAGLVYFVLGRVSIAGSGRLAPGSVNRRLNKGEVLFSETGRAEVLLNSGTDAMLWNSGTVLRIGDRTRIRMDSVEFTDTRVSIETGSAVVTVNQLPQPDHVQIYIGGAVVVIKGAVKTVAKRGQAVRLQDLQIARVDLKDADALQRWAERRGTPPPWIPMAPWCAIRTRQISRP